MTLKILIILITVFIALKCHIYLLIFIKQMQNPFIMVDKFINI